MSDNWLLFSLGESCIPRTAAPGVGAKPLQLMLGYQICCTFQGIREGKRGWGTIKEKSEIIASQLPAVPMETLRSRRHGQEVITSLAE